MKAPPRDLMNTMQRGILTLFCYDDKPNDIGLENVLRQCLQLMSNMPCWPSTPISLAVQSGGEPVYPRAQAGAVHRGELPADAAGGLQLHRSGGPDPGRGLILHADNGGGNNSTFTNHVVTSSGTDTYSAIAASMASLKVPATAAPTAR